MREMSTEAVGQHYFSRLGVNLTPFGRNGGLNLMVSRSAIGFVDGWLDGWISLVKSNRINEMKK